MQPANSRQSKTQKAFTLIELLVVIAIIGILAGMVVVNMSGATESARVAKGINFASSIQRSMATSLSGEWNFNSQNANDSSGNGNNGTISGAVVTTTTPYGNGVAGQYAMSFDGSNDYIDVGNGIGKPANYAITAWIKPNAWGNSGVAMSLRSDGSDFSGFGIMGRSGADMEMSVSNGASSQRYFIEGWNSVNYPSDKWTFIAGTADGSKMRFYKNGIQIGAGADQTVQNGGTAYKISIGRIGEYAGFYFNGLIDDVRIYNSAMPASFILDQYVAGLDKLLENGQITNQDYRQEMLKLNSIYAASE